MSSDQLNLTLFGNNPLYRVKNKAQQSKDPTKILTTKPYPPLNSIILSSPPAQQTPPLPIVVSGTFLYRMSDQTLHFVPRRSIRTSPSNPNNKQLLHEVFDVNECALIAMDPGLRKQ
jgi:hypothetical protein